MDTKTVMYGGFSMGPDLMSPMRRAFPLVALALVVACNGPEGPAGPQGPPGEQGEQGDPGEDGANGAATLVAQTTIERGDDLCVFGGVLTDSGLDNGDGGGIAGDGILQVGEIDASDTDCAGPYEPSTLEVPGGAAGTGIISAFGGDSPTGAAGNGGFVFVGGEGGGGTIALFKTGTVDTSFTTPTWPSTLDFGDRPLVVSADTTLTRVTSADGLPLGTFFQLWDSARVYQVTSVPATRGVGVVGYEAVTGLHVQAGATLTLQAEIFGGEGGPSNEASLGVEGDIYIEGTLVGTPLGLDGMLADIETWSGVLVTGPNSLVDFSGGDYTARGVIALPVGGRGGYLDLSASRYDHVGDQWAAIGGVFLQGTLDVSGGNGQVGGQGGDLTITGGNHVFNTGSIHAFGGLGDIAGAGGSVFVNAGAGLFNSGDVSVYGGDGVVSGGAGGSIWFGTDDYSVESLGGGDVVNSGALRGHGGAAAAACTSGCVGGPGGPVTLLAAGGGLRSSGAIDVHGGSGATGPGGSGGGFFAGVTPEWSEAGAHAPGHLQISGNINASGGSGGTVAGGGGQVIAGLTLGGEFSTQAQQNIAFYGYDEVQVHGGSGARCFDGQSYVCRGGGVILGTSSQQGVPSTVVNHVDIDAHGGSATVADQPGGSGGGFAIGAFLEGAIYGLGAANYGDIDASGGSGTMAGGEGGPVVLVGAAYAFNAGNVDSSGGDTAGMYGGPATGAFMLSAGPASNEGDLTANGGSCAIADCEGGDAGVFAIGAPSIDNSGNFYVSGGAAATGFGGHGGLVELYSREVLTVDSGTDKQISGGAGADADRAGGVGAVLIDGFVVDGDLGGPQVSVSVSEL